jgi:hypothetical protein
MNGVKLEKPIVRGSPATLIRPVKLGAGAGFEPANFWLWARRDEPGFPTLLLTLAGVKLTKAQDGRGQRKL